MNINSEFSFSRLVCFDLIRCHAQVWVTYPITHCIPGPLSLTSEMLKHTQPFVYCLVVIHICFFIYYWVHLSKASYSTKKKFKIQVIKEQVGVGPSCWKRHLGRVQSLGFEHITLYLGAKQHYIYTILSHIRMRSSYQVFALLKTRFTVLGTACPRSATLL